MSSTTQEALVGLGFRVQGLGFRVYLVAQCCALLPFLGGSGLPSKAAPEKKGTVRVPLSFGISGFRDLGFRV